MKNFALIGAAGYIAPRHMEAIKATGNIMVAALDKSDSVGILDKYFPNASFFIEFERFDRHLEKLKRQGIKIDYLVVCSPNYLHDAHIRFGLRLGADVICEKPIALNPWNIEALKEIEKETNHKIYSILQLRLHKSIAHLKQIVDQSTSDKIFELELTYITPRGLWYFSSWKGDVSKSGGIATNIGVHFFDILTWIFGEVKENIVNILTHDRGAGILHLKRAKIRWFLSINKNTLPNSVIANNKATYRSLRIDGEEINFSNGFEDLHTLSYKNILKGKGFDIDSTKNAIDIVHNIRKQKPVGLIGNYHPLADLPLDKHPFE